MSFSSRDRSAVSTFMADEDMTSFFGHEPFQCNLESELAQLFERRHCLLVNSGTSALFAAYFALGLRPRQKIVVPANTFPATVTPLLLLGAVPLFADCNPETGNVTRDTIAECLDENTRAIAVTHLWGQPADLEGLAKLSQDSGLLLLEDVSHAVGASQGTLRVGEVGNVACLSLGSTKLLSGGQGGALLTDDDLLFERATLLTHFGPKSQVGVLDPALRPYAETGLGMNLRIHPLSAAIVKDRLHCLEELLQQRQVRMQRLANGLKGHPMIDVPKVKKDTNRGAWQGFQVVMHEDCAHLRDEFVERLQKRGLEVVPYDMRQLLTRAAIFRNPPDWYTDLSGFNPEEISLCPNADLFASRSIFFPLFLDEPLSVIDKYIEGTWAATRPQSPLR